MCESFGVRCAFPDERSEVRGQRGCPTIRLLFQNHGIPKMFQAAVACPAIIHKCTHAYTHDYDKPFDTDPDGKEKQGQRKHQPLTKNRQNEVLHPKMPILGIGSRIGDVGIR